MSGPRLFSHEEALRRHRTGEGYAHIAADFGVTRGAVYQAVRRQTDPAWRQRLDTYHRDYQKRAVCVDCGKPCTHSRHHQRNNPQESRCHDCANLYYNTNVRGGDAKCATCKEWKPFSEFARHRAAKLRKVHTECRSCQTARRRAYREARKVPCVDCGKPVLPRTPGENGPSIARGLTEPRCKSCAQLRRRGIAA